MRPITQLRRPKRGFTLVELMVVVTMVGILSALAIMGISNYSGRMKNHEAIRVVAAIKVAQEAYRAAHGEYYDVSRGQLDECYPHGRESLLGHELRSWESGAGVDRWNTLGVDVSGNVHFCYSVAAGLAGETMPSVVATEPYRLPETDGPWYIIQATGDPDRDSRRTVYVSTSFGESVDLVQEDGHAP